MWDWVFSTDLETGEVELYDGDKYEGYNLEFVEIKSDSIYLMDYKTPNMLYKLSAAIQF